MAKILSTKWITAIGVALIVIVAASAYFYVQTPPLQKEKIIVMAVGSDPPLLVNVFSTNPAVTTISVPMFNALLTYDPQTLQPKGDLAESWKISPDGLIWTFNLRQNVKWHDGVQFTSADVKFSFEEGILKLHPRGSAFLKPIISNIATPDNYTVVFTLNTPSAAFINAMGVDVSPIGLAKHIYQGTEVLKNPADQAPIGTGPFKFVKWDKGTQIILEKNKEYFKQGKPYIDRVIVRIIPDESARVAALQSGEVAYIPYWYFSIDQAARFVKNPKYVLDPELAPVVLIVGLNIEAPPLSKLDVRHAIAYAINKSEVNDLVSHNLGTPIPNLMTPTMQFWWPDAPTYKFNRTEAERLLDLAGYPRGADGKRFELDIWAAQGASFVQCAEVIRDQLGRVGITVKVVSVDQAAFTDQVYKTRKWSMYIMNFLYALDPAFGMHRLLDSRAIGLPFSNNAPYQSKQMDQLLNAASTEMDLQKRIQIYKDIQTLFNSDLPFVTLTHQRQFSIWSSQYADMISYPTRSHETLENLKLVS